jgi:serine/threonine protein kinase
MLGQTLAGYRIVSRLGEGGMGEVYVAEHTRIERRVAIKVIRAELSSRSDMMARFFAEARATASIHHPGIVQIFDTDMEPGGRAFIVMELLEGESLLARMSREPSFGRDESTAVGLAADVADALAAAHAKGIVHRDLKPDNVFLARDPRAPGRHAVKILDFGIAKLMTAGDDLGPSVRTRTGAMLGTPVYMSPEQCRGTGIVDGRADIYALGCILFELLTGRPPFIYAGFGELISAHLSEMPLPVRRLAPHVSTSLDALIARLLDKDPARRPASMEDVRDQLRTPSLRAVESVRAPAGQTPPTRWPRAQVDSPRARDAGPHPVASTGRGTLIAPPARPSHTTLSEMATDSTRSGRAAGSPWRRRGAAVVVLGLMGGAAALFVLRAAPTRTTAMVVAPTPMTPTPTPTPTAETTMATRGAAGAMVSIDVGDAPADLSATVDGRTATLPIELPSGAGEHTLVFSAPGFRERVIKVDGQRSQRLTLAMQALPAPAAAAVPVTASDDRRAAPVDPAAAARARTTPATTRRHRRDAPNVAPDLAPAVAPLDLDDDERKL